jgi:hypothetical protein
MYFSLAGHFILGMEIRVKANVLEFSVGSTSFDARWDPVVDKG